MLYIEPKESRMKGYCVKCKTTREMKDPKKKQTKNGRWMMQGTCPECGTKVSVFIKDADAKKMKGGDPEIPDDIVADLIGGKKERKPRAKKGGDKDNKEDNKDNKDNNNNNNNNNDNNQDGGDKKKRGRKAKTGGD